MQSVYSSQLLSSRLLGANGNGCNGKAENRKWSSDSAIQYIFGASSNDNVPLGTLSRVHTLVIHCTVGWPDMGYLFSRTVYILAYLKPVHLPDTVMVASDLKCELLIECVHLSKYVTSCT